MSSFPRRYYFFAGTFLITLLLYIDRICISSAKSSIGVDLGLSDIQMGWVLASFALGYALFQVPGGTLGDQFGPRKVVTGIMLLWSLFTALTGAAWNLISMLSFRFVFGASEAGAFPNISRAAFSWVPMNERGIFQGVNFSGSRIGAAFALPLVAYLIQLLGWRGMFTLFGAIGVLMAGAFYLSFRNKPENHPLVSLREKEFILNTRQEEDDSNTPKIPLIRLLASSNMWLAMGQYIGSNFIFFFMLTWLFPYIKGKYELDMLTTGFYTMLPLLAGALGNWTSGFLVDSIYKRGDWRKSRQVPAIIGFSLVVIGILASMYLTSVLGVILGLSLAVFGADMTLSPSWSFCIDIGQKNSGRVSGLMNMAGNLGAFLTALAFPYLQSLTGSNDSFFYLATILGGISMVLWFFMDPTRKLSS